MPALSGSSIIDHFAFITDPRVDRTKEHYLLDILTIALCATISGADEWVAMAAYGNAKREWFDTFLDLPNGIPSHDTFGPGCPLDRIRRPQPGRVRALFPRLGAVCRRADCWRRGRHRWQDRTALA